MEQSHLAKTDTATLVAFDPGALQDKVDEECDWWTGEGDLAAEEARRSLAYVDVQSDGFYRMTLRVGESIDGGEFLKETRLDVPSGRVLFGAAEWLPGEGEALVEHLGALDLEPGEYVVRAYKMRTPDDFDGAYGLELERV